MKKVIKNLLVLLILGLACSLHAQQKMVTGIIVDAETGIPIPGASILVKGTTTGTESDFDGKFSLSAETNASLMVSFLGYSTVEVSISGQSDFEIQLTGAASELDEVVVIGYGTQKKINVTGAVDVVSNEVFKNRAAPSVGALLQGQSPNLNISVTASGGEPGAGNNFNVRGFGTLSGRGAPLILVDGVEMNTNNLDPESIESVSILKDAASAAIYGSRAPFGVVLITTKRGTKNKGVSISYSGNVAVASPIKLPKWQSSLRYVTAYNQSLQNSGQADKFPEEQIDRIKRYMAGTYLPEYDTINPPASIWAPRHEGNANYEWWDEYFKDHVINQKHNINISGGNDKTQFYISGGFFDQGTSYNFAKEFYKRVNLLANITTEVTPWLSFRLNTKYSNVNRSHPTAPWGASSWDPDRVFLIGEMTKFFPTTPMFNVNGTINNPYVLALQQAGPTTMKQDELFMRIGAEIEPIEGWKTNFNYSYNFTAIVNTALDGEIWAEIPTGDKFNFSNNPNKYSQRWHNNNYESLNMYSSYEKNIEDHFLKGLIGYERETKYFSNINGSRNDLITEDVPSFSTATGDITLGDAASHWATEGFFVRLNYNYKEKFLLELNGRYDGSSRFAKDSRWGFFPSVSAGYNISKESFWEPVQNIVSSLKIRGSYGSLGNQNVPNYLYLSNVPINTNLEWIIDGQRPNYANIPKIVSPTLTWETINTLDFGFDAGFFRNKLGVVFDWYERNTLDMFGPSMILPSSLGTTAPQENNASLSTKGWELAIDWKDRIGSELNYSVRFILADSKTHITEYQNLTGQIDQFYVGREIGEIWGYTTTGLIQSEEEAASMPDQSYFFNDWGPGDVRYSDLNGDGKIDDGTRTLDDHGDLSIIGSRSPRFTFGFTSTLDWKNFDFSMFWQGVSQRDLPSESYYGSNVWWGIGTRGNGGGAFYGGMDDYWRPADETNLFGPNTNAHYPKPYVSSETYKNQRVQSRYMLSGAYVRLKNIQLGYNIPTESLKLERLKVYVSAENILTFDNMPSYIDPENAFTPNGLGIVYPLSSTFSVGLNLTF